jgi:hypothetical protein
MVRNEFHHDSRTETSGLDTFVAKKLKKDLAHQTPALVAPRYPLLQPFRRVYQMVQNEFYHDSRT